MHNGKIKILILAAGHGKRMQSELPKVLMQVKGKSMIRHLLEAVQKSGIDEKPVIIVGQKKELVMAELGKIYDYVIQEEQLGTGHAVMCAKEQLGNAEQIIVLYGDQPFTSAETIRKLAQKHTVSGMKITMASVKVPDFEDWRACFTNFSRVIRDKNGKIVRTVEKKDATEEEIKITEVNPCYFCFEASWLWENLEKIKNNNMQKEYYLTDLIKIATEEKIEIESIEIEPHEALGANSKEELGILERFAV
jgi:bifunctional UDP-N-acetylglucosamine pyrophosphorylase/glucosamine-1-phosphate N-acetyltransferase